MQMTEDKVRISYVQSVEEEVSRSLENVKAKDAKSGKRGNRNKSQQSQLTECKERIDISSPDSILSHITNPRLLFNQSTFSSLPLYFQYKLVQSLPACDQVVTEQGWVKPSASSLTNEFFTKATNTWFENLKDGRFTPEYLQRKKQEMEREKGKIDPWKSKHFEPIWGQKQKSQQVTLSEYERIPRIVLPDLFPQNHGPAANGDSDSDYSESSHSQSPSLTSRPDPTKVLSRTGGYKRPRPLSKQSQHHPSPTVPPANTLIQASDQVPGAMGHVNGIETTIVISNKQTDRIGEVVTTSKRISDAPKDELWHQKNRKWQSSLPVHSGVQAGTGRREETRISDRNAALFPESKSPEKRMAFSPAERRQCPPLTPRNSMSHSESQCSPVKSGEPISATPSSPEKPMPPSKDSTCNPVSPVRTRSQKRQKTGHVTKNWQGIDEQRSKDICKKVVDRSANNKLFYVTHRGSIQQLNNEQESSAVTSSTLIKTLPNDTEIFPVCNANHSDAAHSPSKAELTVLPVNGFQGDTENSASGLESRILNSILSKNRTASDCQRLPLSYKLPDGITITPMTTSNNQVPVITRTECPALAETPQWLATVAGDVQQKSGSSEHVLQELNRLPSQITVIPLGPCSSLDMPVEGEGNEDELEMEQEEVGDLDQTMGSTSPDCVCNLKAMVQCAKCGALCHSDCIGPSGYCVRCLVRVNNHSVGYVQPVPLIANANSNQNAYVYPI